MAGEFVPFRYRGTAGPPTTPTFRSTLGAGAVHTLDPLLGGLSDFYDHDRNPDPEFRAIDHIEDEWLDFSSDLLGAVSQEHMDIMKSRIERSIDRRRIFSESSLFSNLAAGIFDPVNLIALPFGGPAYTIGRSALRVGAGAATIQTGVELAVMHPFDPVSTAEESAVNVAASFVFGGLLGGGVGAFGVRQRAAYAKTEQLIRAEMEVIRTTEDLSSMTHEELMVNQPQSDRFWGKIEDEELASRIDELETKLVAEEGTIAALRQEENQADLLSLRAERGLRKRDELGIDPSDPFSIAPSAFTDSFLYKMVPTPFKSVMQSGTATNSMKKAMALLGGDHGVMLYLNFFGLPSPRSVHVAAARRQGEWGRVQRDLRTIWGEDTGAVKAEVLDINAVDLKRNLPFSKENDISFKNWSKEISRLRTMEVTDLTANQTKAVEALNRFFKDAEIESREAGFMGDTARLKKDILHADEEIVRLEAIIARGSKGVGLARSKLHRHRLAKAEAEFSLANPSQAALEPYLPRFFDLGVIRKDRDGFGEILKTHYRENPYGFVKKEDGGWERVRMFTDDASLQERVDSTISRVLNEEDVDAVSFGVGRSKHIRHRELDIPNSKVWDYMVQDPLAIMKSYNQRIGPRIEFQKTFGRGIDDVVSDLRADMEKHGVKQTEIDKHLKDFRVMYDRIAGVVTRDPHRIDQKIAYWMKEFAAANYMGSSGIAAIPDFARVTMEHDLGDIMRGLEVMMDGDLRNLTKQELELTGQVMDIIQNTAHMRVVNDLSNDIVNHETWEKARSAFYILNGLAPLTQIAKQMDGIVRGHTLIDYSVKLTDNKASPFEIQYLARYSIGKDEAAKIAAAPWQRHKNDLIFPATDDWLGHIEIPKDVKIVSVGENGGPITAPRYVAKSKTLFFDRQAVLDSFPEKPWVALGLDEDAFRFPAEYANFEAYRALNTGPKTKAKKPKPAKAKTNADGQKDTATLYKEFSEIRTVDKDTINIFREAMNSGIINTIMTATPADRPILSDGLVFVPMRIASKFGMKEDPNFSGYARMETPMLALPLQFYAYTLANVNKTVAAYAQGSVKNRLIGSMTMMTLGYMAMKMKTPEYVWDQMEWRDRFGRAFDYSGIVPLYSDMAYTSLQTSLALGGPNITGGLMQPRFRQEKSMVDAGLTIAGAGPSITYDLGKGIADFASGNFGEGSKQVVRNLPFTRLWMWKDFMNEQTRGWGL